MHDNNACLSVRVSNNEWYSLNWASDLSRNKRLCSLITWGAEAKVGLHLGQIVHLIIMIIFNDNLIFCLLITNGLDRSTGDISRYLSRLQIFRPSFRTNFAHWLYLIIIQNLKWISSRTRFKPIKISPSLCLFSL